MGAGGRGIGGGGRGAGGSRRRAGDGDGGTGTVAGVAELDDFQFELADAGIPGGNFAFKGVGGLDEVGAVGDLALVEHFFDGFALGGIGAEFEVAAVVDDGAGGVLAVVVEHEGQFAVGGGVVGMLAQQALAEGDGAVHVFRLARGDGLAEKGIARLAALVRGAAATRRKQGKRRHRHANGGGTAHDSGSGIHEAQCSNRARRNQHARATFFQGADGKADCIRVQSVATEGEAAQRPRSTKRALPT